MNNAGKILSFSPSNAIPGGELVIECEGLNISEHGNYACLFDGIPGRLVGASSTRILVIVPEALDSCEVEVCLESLGDKSEARKLVVGKKVAGDLHLVANPAVDPKDGSILLTRSGSRGQKLPVTLFRLEKDGYLNELSVELMNPTGIAFNQSGELFITARADGEVCRISDGDEVVPYASNLGISTGIAFNEDGEMFVGDRSGTIYKVQSFGSAESFAELEPSVSAFHLAFGIDGRLYVSAPGLCSYDSIYAIDRNGEVEVFFRGLGRPQGLAFDREGNLYIAACFHGRHGIVRISADGKNADIFVAGMNIVGLCFDNTGNMIVSTNEDVYQLPLGIYGTLLD